MKIVPPPLFAPADEYDEFLDILEEMKGRPGVDPDKIDKQIAHVKRRRALAVRVVAAQDGSVRLSLSEAETSEE